MNLPSNFVTTELSVAFFFIVKFQLRWSVCFCSCSVLPATLDSACDRPLLFAFVTTQCFQLCCDPFCVSSRDYHLWLTAVPVHCTVCTCGVDTLNNGRCRFFYRSGVSKHFTTVSLPPESIISDLESTPVYECCVVAVWCVCLHCYVNIFSRHFDGLCDV